MSAMKLNKVLTSIGAAVCTSLLGIELSTVSVLGQSSPRPYVVFVNGQGNCCASSGYMERLTQKLFALGVTPDDIRNVPYSNFDDGGRSRGDWTSNDSSFLQDGANFINNQLDRNRPLILIGHSYGGDSILKLLPRLNRRVQFVAVIDPVSTAGMRAPLTRDLGVSTNVDYFFNRWQENEPFPFDFKHDGRIKCNAKITCDQAKQNHRTYVDGTPRTTSCDFFEFCRSKQVPSGHQTLATDEWIQRIIGDKITETLKDFRPPSQNNPTAIISAGGLCLDAKDYGESRVGNPLHLWDCNEQPAQRWQFTEKGQIVSAGGLCLDAKDYGESRVGNPLHLWDCNGQPAQRWSRR